MAQFEIVELTPTGLVPLNIGRFTDGRAAARKIPSLCRLYPDKKLQPRPVAEATDWRAREQQRFEDGTYEEIDWDLKPIKDHFARVSQHTPEAVEFIANEESGMLDRTSSFHVKTYLYRFYPHLTDEERRELVWAFTGTGPDHVLFADTEEEIAHVYRYGPSSCMSERPSNYASDCMPAEVYAAGDLSVAYIKDDDRITARAVCWPEKKIYGRLYGDELKMRKALDALGYAQNYMAFTGARLLKYWIDDGECEDGVYSGYVCPYLDMVGWVRDSGRYLVIDPEGNIAAQNTHGLAQESDGYQCACCGKVANGSSIRWISHLNDYRCRSCPPEGYVFDSQGALRHDFEVTLIDDGTYVATSSLDYYSFVCPITGKRVSSVAGYKHKGGTYSLEGLTRFLEMGS